MSKMTPEDTVDSVLHPENWELHKKGTQPDTTRLLLEGMRQAGGLIQQVLRAEGIPEPVRAVLQDALDALEEPGSEAKPMTIPETLAAISRHQNDQSIRLDLQEAQLGQLLISRSVPTPLPRPEELSGRTIRRVMRKIDSDVQAAHENITDAAIRHHIQAEIERAKRG